MEGEKIFKLLKSQRQLLHAVEVNTQEAISRIRQLGQTNAAFLLSQFRSELFVSEDYKFDFKEMAFRLKDPEPKEGENEKNP